MSAIRISRVATKFNLILFATLLAISAIAIPSVSAFRHAAMERQLVDGIERQMNAYADALAKPLWDLDHSAVRGALTVVASSPAILCASARDFASQRTVRSIGVECDRIESYVVTTLAQPIAYAGNVVGNLSVSINRGIVRESITGEVGREALIAVILIAAAIACAFFAFRVTVLRPIERIVAALSANSQQDSEPILVDWSSSDEMGRISDAINQMIHETWNRTQVLSESEERLRSILDASPFPLFVTRIADQKIRYANQHAREIFGIDDRILGTARCGDFYTVPEERTRLLERLLVDGSARDMEARLRRADGTPFWALISAKCLDYQDTPCIFVAFSDISERKQAESLMRKAKEEAQEASRAKSDFLAHMSHELRTPLNAVIGFSEMMRTEVFGPLGNPRYVEYAQDIRQSGEYLLTLINDVLDLSKVEAGKLIVQEDLCDLAVIVNSAVDIVRDQAANAELVIRKRFDNDLTNFRGDPRLLSQILINLLANAIKFTKSGGTIDVSAGLGPHGGLVLAVADTGVGIAPKDLPHILEPFQQGPQEGVRRHSGTGLGLPLVKKLIEAHGGRFEIVSEPNVGTTASACFPEWRSNASIPEEPSATL